MKPVHRNVRVAVDVLRLYKVSALVRLRVNGGKLTLDGKFVGDAEVMINPRYFAGEVEFLVSRSSIEGL